jgi:hypothetical protein
MMAGLVFRSQVSGIFIMVISAVRRYSDNGSPDGIPQEIVPAELHRRQEKTGIPRGRRLPRKFSPAQPQAGRSSPGGSLKRSLGMAACLTWLNGETPSVVYAIPKSFGLEAATQPVDAHDFAALRARVLVAEEEGRAGTHDPFDYRSGQALRRAGSLRRASVPARLTHGRAQAELQER